MNKSFRRNCSLTTTSAAVCRPSRARTSTTSFEPRGDGGARFSSGSNNGGIAPRAPGTRQEVGYCGSIEQGSRPLGRGGVVIWLSIGRGCGRGPGTSARAGVKGEPFRDNRDLNQSPNYSPPSVLPLLQLPTGETLGKANQKQVRTSPKFERWPWPYRWTVREFEFEFGVARSPG